MSSRTVQIKGHDGQFSGYLSLPAGTPKAGIVVIQEIFGVNDVMRGLTDSYAAQGYAALCPDLFWRIEPGIQITDKTEPEMKRAFELFGLFDVDKGVEDIDATIDYVRETLRLKKVGAVGFCLGGLLAYLTAARTDADATISYYGVSIDKRLEEAEKLAQPLLLHIAGQDQFVSPAAQDSIKANLHNHPQVTIFDYPAQGHAFARVGGAHYDQAAAELAATRSAEFFRANLG